MKQLSVLLSIASLVCACLNSCADSPPSQKVVRRVTTAVETARVNKEVGITEFSRSASSNSLLDDQESLGDPINVKNFGALGNGENDDTSGIQTAVNKGASTGLPVYFPPGIYLISSPITLPQGTKLIGRTGATSISDWTRDWAHAQPATYGDTESIIQYSQGQHGAIFAAENRVSIEKMSFRYGGGRNANDMLFSNGPSWITIKDCRFENLRGIARNSASAFGAWTISDCLFQGGGPLLYGSLVDCFITDNRFVSTEGSAIDIQTGGSSNTISGNRFEWGDVGISIFSSAPTHPNVITGNTFDANRNSAIYLFNAQGNTITGNAFRRNGRDRAGVNSCHIYIKGRCTGNTIGNNTFKAGSEDANKTLLWPHYSVTFESAGESKILFSGNNFSQGYTRTLFNDVYRTSKNAAILDSFTIANFEDGIGVKSDGTTDNSAVIISNISSVVANHPTVYIAENRTFTDFVSAPNIKLVGIGTPSISFNGGGVSNLKGVENINLAGWVAGTATSVSYGLSAPTKGTWSVGSIVYNTAPTPGSSIGWVCTTGGTPGTWKSFGNIAN